jgi:hypothetical protein
MVGVKLDRRKTEGETWVDSRGEYWKYLYLLRVPLLAWLLLIALAPLSVWGGAPLGPLLRGLFDLAPPSTVSYDPGSLSFMRVPLAFGLVTLVSLMAAATVGVTARLVLLDGEARFGAGRVNNTPGVRITLRVVPVLAAVVLVAGAWTQSWSDGNALRVLGMAAGTAAGAGIFWLFATYGQNALHAQLDAGRKGRFSTWLSVPISSLVAGIEKALSWSPHGFCRDGALQPRHVFAFFHLVFAVGIYLFLSAVKSASLRDTGGPGGHPWVPTLCVALALLIFVCYLLTAVAFVFDRFRVPMLLVIVCYLSVVGLSARADSFFETKPRQAGLPPANEPIDQLTRQPAGGASDTPVVLVAASGGGIQAAAWTARVLSGLHQEAPTDPGRRFDEAVRVISAASGGSVGALYVLDAYSEKHRLPAIGSDESALDTFRPVVQAEASSLDEVAWGLVYSDFVYSLFPFIRVGAGMLTSDRGSALESAWRRQVWNRTLPLDIWRADARDGKRPAVIFNATLVESGERLLIGTADLERPAKGDEQRCPQGGVGDAKNVGRRDFRTLYCDREIDAVTAARLSATFPYVSPPARILRAKGPRSPEYHVVDGGYYDNYGVATLIEWLDDAIANAPPGTRVPRIVIVEIRDRPVGDAKRPTGSRGLLFQALHPISTMLNVRGAGQLSHNELDMRLLRHVNQIAGANVWIRRVIFEFPRIDSRGLTIRAPLSWHLTEDDKRHLRNAWKSMTECRTAVGTWLQGSEAPSSSSTRHPRGTVDNPVRCQG